MYETRAAKLDQLEPITIDFDGNRVEITTLEQLKQLVKSAIDKDLANTRPTTFAYETNLEKLKAAIFKAYKVETNDFRESIYTDKKPEFKVPDKAPDRPALPLGDIWINGLGEARPELLPGNIGVNGASETRPELTPGNIGVNGASETRPSLESLFVGVKGSSVTAPTLPLGAIGISGAAVTRPVLPLLTLVENSLQDTVSQAESNAKVDVSLWKEIDSSKKLSSAIPYTAQKVLPKTGDAANTGSIGIMVLLTSIGLVSKRRKTEN